MTALTWTDIERITQGQLGRTISAVCPFCSHTRRTINQRKRVFAVRLKEPDFAIYNCMHCGEAGYVHPERSAQIIDLTERKRLREEAERREREDKQQRTASALQLWSERKPFRGSLAETYLRDSRGIGVWCEAFDLDESHLDFIQVVSLAAIVCRAWWRWSAISRPTSRKPSIAQR